MMDALRIYWRCHADMVALWLDSVRTRNRLRTRTSLWDSLTPEQRERALRRVEGPEVCGRRDENCSTNPPNTETT